MPSIDNVKKELERGKRGRPRVSSIALTVRLRDLELAELDNWRLNQTDEPPRPEAIRRLIRQGTARKQA